MNLFSLFFVHYILKDRGSSLVRRTAWLSTFALTISIAALIVVMSVMAALNRNIQERMLAVEPHLVLQAEKDSDIEKLRGEIGAVLGGSLDEASVGNGVTAFESHDLVLRSTQGRFRGAVARGLPKDVLRKTLEQIEKVGRQSRSQISEQVSPSTLSSDFAGIGSLEPQQVLLGVDLAASLGVFEGESLLIFPAESLIQSSSELPSAVRVTVGRILTTNLADIDSQFLFFVQGETLQSLRNSAGRNLGLELRLKDPNFAAKAKAELLESHPGWKLNTWKERNSALFFALRLERILIGVFLSMAALVALLSIFSVQSLLVTQKSREMALLQAIGLSQKRTEDLFFRLGFATAAMGIVMGAVLGSLIALYIQAYPLQVLPEIYYDSRIPALVRASFVWTVLVAALLLAAAGSAWVARGIQGLGHRAGSSDEQVSRVSQYLKGGSY